MKTHLYCLITLMLIGLASTALAQEKIDQYQSIYLGKSFDIKVDQDTYKYWIGCASVDENHNYVAMHFESEKLPALIEFLITVKNTYSKWREIAKANSVTNLEKDIEAKPFVCTADFMGQHRGFDHGVTLTPRVKTVDGNMLLIINSGMLESGPVRTSLYSTHDGFYLVFTKPSEVDEFISKIDINKARAFFDKKKKTEGLFKN